MVEYDCVSPCVDVRPTKDSPCQPDQSFSQSGQSLLMLAVHWGVRRSI